ncbi:MAG: peptidylprolyl isomerase [Actinomycetota bacterium]|nr:peptidylprolyl isomerase [Actinomycetota bacterium]
MKKLDRYPVWLAIISALVGLVIISGCKSTTALKSSGTGDASKAKTEKAAPSAPQSEAKKEETTNTPTRSAERVVIETDKDKMVLVLYPDVAPKTVDNFKKLIGQGFYNGLTFHRVVPGFVIQGGDPKGDGSGGPGYTIPAEFNDKPHIRGTLAMARAQDPDSAGSQFYITLAPQPSLDRNYTVFGQVVEGMDVIDKIVVGDKMNRVYLEPAPAN